MSDPLVVVYTGFSGELFGDMLTFLRANLVSRPAPLTRVKGSNIAPASPHSCSNTMFPPPPAPCIQEVLHTPRAQTKLESLSRRVNIGELPLCCQSKIHSLSLTNWLKGEFDFTCTDGEHEFAAKRLSTNIMKLAAKVRHRDTAL